MTIQGSTGNDDLIGTTGNDIFDLTGGGDDKARGLSGNDTFLLGATFNAHDRLFGGTGMDTVSLDGDYGGAAKVKLGAHTLQNIENMVLAGGHNYNITLSAATVPQFATFTVDASTLGHADKLVFDASAGAVDDLIVLTTGAGKVRLTGGIGTDDFHLTRGLKVTDTIDGGNGDANYLHLNANTNIVMADTTVHNLSTIWLEGGDHFRFKTADANIDAGKSMYFNVTALDGNGTFVLNASAETDGTVGIQGFQTLGHYDIRGSAGNDFYDLADGGVGSTLIYHGDLGSDTVYAEAAEGGTDTFIYTSAAQSTGRDAHDYLRFINFNTDHMEINNYHCNGIGVSSNATVNFATFDTDLATAASGHMSQEGAALVVVSGGTYTNHVFLVCDINGDAAYTTGQDMVFDISATSGALSTSFFG